jgi:putative solute:sodium symporter small subunit
MIITLAIWFFFSTVIFMFGAEINSASFLGYPLAYYMTAQGSLLAFVLLIFWFANRQEKIDEECGFGGEDD